MRLVALLLPLLFFVPTAVAERSFDHHYVMALHGCAGGGALIRNCQTYGPYPHETDVWANVTDLSGETVRVRICHEWSYDDGSHPTVRCSEGCSPSHHAALTHPPWPWNTTYRVIVDLRNGPSACDAAATAGTMRVTFV